MTEFTALANHRKSIRAEIAEVTERVRQVQLDALASVPAARRNFGGTLSPAALLFLMAGLPKLLTLEAGVGVSTAHAEVVQAVERFLDAAEPAPAAKPRRRTRPRAG